MKWNALPEYFVEDVAEIVLFYLQYVFLHIKTIRFDLNNV